MKKISNLVLACAFGFVMVSLASCNDETCVTCTMAGQDDTEMCSNGSVLEDTALSTWQTGQELVGWTCN